MLDHNICQLHVVYVRDAYMQDYMYLVVQHVM